MIEKEKKVFQIKIQLKLWSSTEKEKRDSNEIKQQYKNESTNSEKRTDEFFQFAMNSCFN